jgi:hypothetical protein
MAPNRINARWLRFISALLAFATLAVLGGCGGGSGAPNNPFKPPPPVPGPLSILPSSATVFSNMPATLTITGGVPPYFVVSSNTAILPVGASVTNGTIVLLPANVLADTAVLITVQDSAGTRATATVTVRPAPIFNTLTITPASAACGANSICSGGTATARVTVTGAGGVGIPNRQVRFEVVSGAFAILSNDPANPLVSTLTVVSDQFGVAQVIIQATAGVPTQPALLRATELTTGNQQTAQFTIVQTINGSAVLSVVPSDVTFIGADTTQCTNNFRADYFIFGGTPPYQVHTTTAGVILTNVPVLVAGGFFTAITNPPPCVDPEVFSIVDAAGLQTTATLHNLVGTTPPTPPTPPPALVLSPSSYTQTGCTAATQFTFLITGGTPPFNASVSSTPPLTTPSPQTLNSAPGTFTVNWSGPSNTTAFVIVVDSNIQQQTATAQVTCSP